MKSARFRRRLSDLFRLSFFIAVSLTALFGHYYKSGSEPFAERDAQEKARAQESYFVGARYHFVEDVTPRLFLDSEEMTLIGESADRIFMTMPKGVVFSETGDPYNYRAKNGRVEQGKSILYLEGDVFVESESSEFLSDSARYEMQGDRLFGNGSVTTTNKSQTNGDVVIINSDSVEARPKSQHSHYLGDVDGKIIRARSYEPPIFFKSQELTLDMIAGKADLLTDVSLRKQQVTARSKRGEIFLENYNKKLKYYVLYDDVKVSEKVQVPGPNGMRRFTRRALSEKLEGIIAEDKIILTGYPKVFQERDVIKGNRIILRENNEVVEVDDANTNFILR